jgi:hypothetical protein
MFNPVASLNVTEPLFTPINCEFCPKTLGNSKGLSKGD